MTRCSTAWPYQLFSKLREHGVLLNSPHHSFIASREDLALCSSLFMCQNTQRKACKGSVSKAIAAQACPYIMLSWQRRQEWAPAPPPLPATDSPSTYTSVSLSRYTPPLSLSFNNRCFSETMKEAKRSHLSCSVF